MTILDTFTLVFNSNAKRAQAEVDALDKQIAQMAAKGKQRSEAEATQLTDLRKQRAQTTQDLKDQQKVVTDLDSSFGGLVENLGKLVIGYLSLDGLKTGIRGAEKFTASLQMSSQWLGINAKQLAAWDEAIQTVGGAPGEGIASIKALHDTFVKMGFGSSMPDFLKALKEEAKIFSSVPLEQAEMIGLKQGLPEATILFLRQGEAVGQLVDKMASLNGVTDDGTRIARAFEAQWAETKTTFRGLFIELNNNILPAVTELLKKTDEVVGIGADPATKYDNFGEYVDQEGLGSVLLHVLKRGFGGIGSAVRFGAAGFQSHDAREQYYRDQGFWWAEPAPPGAPRPPAGGSRGLDNNNPGNLQPGGTESSFPTPQAGLAAMAANLRRYGRRGWNTIGAIVDHWAPAGGKGNSPATAEAYKAALEQATGFGRGQQLDLNDAGTLDALIGAMIVQENGRNPYSDTQIMQAIMMGKQAMNTVTWTPFAPGAAATAGGNQSVSVTTGDIHVQTQATDAQGIAGAIGTSLRNQLRMTINNIDDGVLA